MVAAGASALLIGTGGAYAFVQHVPPLQQDLPRERIDLVDVPRPDHVEHGPVTPARGPGSTDSDGESDGTRDSTGRDNERRSDATTTDGERRRGQADVSGSGPRGPVSRPDAGQGDTRAEGRPASPGGGDDSRSGWPGQGATQPDESTPQGPDGQLTGADPDTGQDTGQGDQGAQGGGMSTTDSGSGNSGGPSRPPIGGQSGQTGPSGGQSGQTGPSGGQSGQTGPSGGQSGPRGGRPTPVQPAVPPAPTPPADGG